MIIVQISRRVVRSCAGDNGGTPSGGIKRAGDARLATKAIATVRSRSTSTVRSRRRPVEVEGESGFEAGAAGSLDRHSHERSDTDSRASSATFKARGTACAFGGQHRQSVDGVVTTQHDFRATVDRADASATIESIPTIAARANQGSRRWRGMAVMATPGIVNGANGSTLDTHYSPASDQDKLRFPEPRRDARIIFPLSSMNHRENRCDRDIRPKSPAPDRR